MYHKKTKGWNNNLDLIFLSLVSLHLSLILSYFIHIDYSLVYKNIRYLNISVIISLFTLLSSIIFQIFCDYKHKSFVQNFWSNLKLIVIVEILVVFYFFGTQQGIEYSRIIFSIYFPLFYLFFSVILLSLYKKIYSYLSKNTKNYTSLLIITTSSLYKTINRDLLSDPVKNYEIVGLLLLDENTISDNNQINNIEIVNTDSYQELANKKWIDEAIVITDVVSENLSKIMEELTYCGCTVHFALTNNFYQKNLKQFSSTFGPYKTITTTLNYMSNEQVLLKRLLDICGALVGCFVTLLLTILISPVIYILSPGPIFFTQKRVGMHGKVFKIYKFRTMYMDAEERKKELENQNIVKDGYMFKMEFDPRIIGNKILPTGEQKTGFGALLRKLSIDEFPQFFNVLKGDMSIVGTRPPTLDEWKKYGLYHKSRLFIKPGITGLWQVSGRSTICDFEKVVALDRKYIKEWSFFNDLLIILKTIKVVIFHKDSF